MGTAREPEFPWNHDTWAESWKTSRSCPGRWGQLSICRISSSRTSLYWITRRGRGWGMLGRMSHTRNSEDSRRNLASQCCSVELINKISHTHTHHVLYSLFLESRGRILWEKRCVLWEKLTFFFHPLIPVLRVLSCIIHVGFSWETKSPKDCEIMHYVTFQGIKHHPVYKGTNSWGSTFLHLSLN